MENIMRERFQTHDESRMSAHRFRWLAAVIGLLLWQNWTLRVELRRLNNHVEEAVVTAEDASEYARRSWDAADKCPKELRRIILPAPRGPLIEYHARGALLYVGPPQPGRPQPSSDQVFASSGTEDS
jgi:hypothetical protein